MTNAERMRKYRQKNPHMVLKDNARRRQRKDLRLHNRWKMLYNWVRTRCTSKKSQSYQGYGSKGIKCLLTWLDIARVWFRDEAWMMKYPHLDRIDPDKHYEPDNVRFIERAENLARRRFKSGDREPGEEG